MFDFIAAAALNWKMNFSKAKIVLFPAQSSNSSLNGPSLADTLQATKAVCSESVG